MRLKFCIKYIEETYTALTCLCLSSVNVCTKWSHLHPSQFIITGNCSLSHIIALGYVHIFTSISKIDSLLYFLSCAFQLNVWLIQGWSAASVALAWCGNWCLRHGLDFCDYSPASMAVCMNSFDNDTTTCVFPFSLFSFWVYLTETALCESALLRLYSSSLPYWACINSVFLKLAFYFWYLPQWRYPPTFVLCWLSQHSTHISLNIFTICANIFTL